MPRGSDIVSFSVESGGSWYKVADVGNASVSLTLDPVDFTEWGKEYYEFTPGPLRGSVELTLFIDLANSRHDALRDMTDGSVMGIRLDLADGAQTSRYEGDALLTRWQISGSARELVRVSAAFTFTGDITIT